MYEAFRYELDPNRAQRVSLAKHVGTAGGLARCLEALERGERVPNAVELHKAWNLWKRVNAPWWVEVSKCAPQEALRDLEKAFQGWRAGRAGKPRFKRKKSLDDNKARLTGSIRVFPRHVKLPSRLRRRRPLGGRKLRTKEPTEKLLGLLSESKARVLSATISREADRWFVSLTCEVERPDPPVRQGEPVGIDLGLCAWTRLEAPKPLKKALKLLRRQTGHNLPKQIMSGFLSRKQKGSKNHLKASLSLARLHRRVRNIRRDFLHKVTTWLAKTKPVIVVEDGRLRRRGLSRSKYLSRSVADVGWGTFRRMLEYKTRWYGSRLVPFYAPVLRLRAYRPEAFPGPPGLCLFGLWA